MKQNYTHLTNQYTLQFYYSLLDKTLSNPKVFVYNTFVLNDLYIVAYLWRVFLQKLNSFTLTFNLIILHVQY